MKWLIYYLIIINMITFIIYEIDKFLAKKRYNRISERCLFFLGFAGGSFGAIFAMLIFRHKTKKIKFYIWNILWGSIWIFLCIKYALIKV